MARYEIELDDESILEADDARFVAGGRFLEIIPRKAPSSSGGAPERIVLNSAVVRAVHFRPIGFKGGWRFDGGKDSSFDPSEGSV
jgi:hypothetical protein